MKNAGKSAAASSARTPSKSASKDASTLPAPEELMEQYAALVRKTAAACLENPEDIKECVNDTFLEFYLHSDRYDPWDERCAPDLSGSFQYRQCFRRRLRRTKCFLGPLDCLAGKHQCRRALHPQRRRRHKCHVPVESRFFDPGDRAEGVRYPAGITMLPKLLH